MGRRLIKWCLITTIITLTDQFEKGWLLLEIQFLLKTKGRLKVGTGMGLEPVTYFLNSSIERFTTTLGDQALRFKPV